MHSRKETGWLKHWDFILLDLLIMQLCLLISYFIFKDTKLANQPGMWSVTGVTLFLSQLVAITFVDSFKNILRRGYYKELVAFSKHLFAVVSVNLIILYIIHEIGNLSRVFYGTSLAMYGVFAYLSRVLLKKVLHRRGISNQGNRSVVILTERASVDAVLKNFQRPEFNDIHIHGIVLADQPTSSSERRNQIPVYGMDEKMVDFLAHEWVNEVFVILGDQTLLPQSLLDEFIRMGITVHSCLVGPDEFGDQYVERFGNYTVLTTSLKIISSKQAFAKRLLDIFGGLVGSILAILFTILFGPIIFLKDPGPIFFVQKRVGRDGKVFRILKLRTMYQDAEERKAALMDQNQMQGHMFKIKDDPRILPGIGSFLRRTSIDEFPQFFNVLKGDMSLVGTRPPTLDEWNAYEHNYRVRMSIKPGITGLWQTSGRSKITDFDEVVKLDAQYIRDWNFGLDIKLILKTIVVIFQRDGAE